MGVNTGIYIIGSYFLSWNCLGIYGSPASVSKRYIYFPIVMKIHGANTPTRYNKSWPSLLCEPMRVRLITKTYIKTKENDALTAMNYENVNIITEMVVQINVQPVESVFCGVPFCVLCFQCGFMGNLSEVQNIWQYPWTCDLGVCFLRKNIKILFFFCLDCWLPCWLY